MGPNWSNNANWLSDSAYRPMVSASPPTATDGSLGWNSVDNQLSWDVFLSELGNLSNLTELLASWREPVERLVSHVELGNLSNLTSAGPHQQPVERARVPVELSNLSNLQMLHGLTENQLIGIDPRSSWATCPTCNELSFTGNQLSGSIPSELGSLAQLGRAIPRQQSVERVNPVGTGNLTNLRESVAQ